MKLVIVESPTKARKLASFLGSGYQVEASVGHVRDLPKQKLGVDLEHDFEPEYEVSKDKTKVIKRLAELAQKAELIYLATDPDREGEAIAWHVQYLLEHDKHPQAAKKFVRASFHEITKSAVAAALNNPEEIRLNLVDAQQARRVLDRLVGYKISPVLWKKIRRGLSAGRVQSVALRLVVEREREIEAFKPEEYWELFVGLSTEDKNLLGKIFTDGKANETLPNSVVMSEVVEVQARGANKLHKFTPKSETDVTSLVKGLPTAKYHVESLERKERQRRPYPPFSTSTLQQSAASVFGFTSKQTMSLAQQLYEEGLITYHRTDSFNLSAQSLEMARNFINQAYGDQYLPEKPNYYASKSKNAQEAHEAIRVTDVAKREVTGAKFTANHQKLYDLIWKRFLASQMKAAVYDQTTVLITATLADSSETEKATLKANGSILKFDGWMKLFPGQGDSILPDLSADQSLYYGDLSAQQKFTQPPARFNDASLVKELEKRGIGRPSTYASIISVIVDRGYVERQDKRYFATPIGMAVNDFLMKHFAEVMDYDFTAQMEDDLDSIARGEKQWRKIIGEFYWPLEKKIDKTVDSADRMQIPVEKTGEKCPDCSEGEIVIRSGKYGKFKSCSRFPECKFTENIVEKVEGAVCPLCQQGEVVVKPSRWGKSFFGCSRYPECDWASWKKPQPGEKISQAEWKKQQAARAERKAARAQAQGKVAKKTAKKPARKKAVTKKQSKKTT